MKDIRLRQIHLDFHTSESIPDIGIDFDADRFADTLLGAHVDSITCFTRGHHGWLYYPSKKFPDRIHPHLKCKDLFGEQLRACHERGINVPAYLPIQWDHLIAAQHPEWIVTDEHGKPVGSEPYEAGFYRQICLNTPYRKFVIEQAVEVMEMYPVDGIFLDIINVKECSCRCCKAAMVEKGMDPQDKENRKAHMLSVIKEFTQTVSAALRAVQSDIKIYYNHSHVRITHRDIIDGFTHLELESLPSGGWGYMDFPITARYARTLGIPLLGMTGKFHTSWGDFHSLRNQPALEYECFRSLALDSGCSIGDQLHPFGKLDPAAYSLIGKIYESVEKKEPWCFGAVPAVEIAVVSPDGFWGDSTGYFSAEIEGISRLLTESGQQFDVIDQTEDLSKYKLVMLPDLVKLTPDFATAVNVYIKSGGKVISSYKSLQNTEVDWGFSESCSAPFSPDFIVPGFPLCEGLEPVEYVMYEAGECVEVKEGEVLLEVHEPFFNRTWDHFCSHQHAPSTFEGGYPAVVQNGGHIHFIHPVFHTYTQKHPKWYKTLVVNAIHRLIGNQMVSHDGPSFILMTINRQEGQRRFVLHSLGYVCERSAREFDIIEDAVSIFDTEVILSLDVKIQSARVVPEGTELEITERDGKQAIVIPRIDGHNMVELNY
jgi:putative glycosyl hydrolase-like family 6 (GHL6) protein/glycosyl hydrolase family 42 (putative beta-galactosidase)